jgi:hypothetical protein
MAHLKAAVATERQLITIEFAPKIHEGDSTYNYEHPKFVFGDIVALKLSSPHQENKFTVCGMELIESKTPSGILLNQPRWKYKISDGQKTFWFEESALVLEFNKDICSGCSHFQDYAEASGRGWCHLFNQPARKHHQRTFDCEINDSRPLYSPGEIVKIIDPQEHYLEWADFVVVAITKAHDQTEYYYSIASVSTPKMVDQVAESEICLAADAKNINTDEVF